MFRFDNAVTPVSVLTWFIFGFTSALLDSAIQSDQSFRNQSVGNRCSSAASGPRLNGRDLYQNIVRTCFGIFNENVEIPVFMENAGVEQAHIPSLPGPLTVYPNKFIIRIRCLRILVEILHIGVSRRAVKVEIILLDILPMVALAVGQSE